jgi:hypothetical protein
MSSLKANFLKILMEALTKLSCLVDGVAECGAASFLCGSTFGYLYGSDLYTLMYSSNLNNGTIF